MSNPQNFSVQYAPPFYYDQNVQIQTPQNMPGPYLSQMQQIIPQMQNNYNGVAQFPQASTSLTEHYAAAFPPIPVAQVQEYDWQSVEYKKRSRKDSPEGPMRITKQPTLKDYWLNQPPKTSNRYKELEDQEQTDKEQETTTETSITTKVIKPPPLFVVGVKFIQPLVDLLKTVAPNQYIQKCLNNDEVKIQANTKEAYQAIIKALMEKDTQFHTYQLKEDRSFRVVLRNMHPSTDIEQLKAEINALGHEVRNVSNIRQRETKLSLPLFHIELKAQPNNKEIYNVNSLLHTIVKFEPPRPKREVPQCMNCQRYGHTKKFCFRNPRCVKCTGNHATSQCSRKIRNNDVKCTNCGENHPANYKGCRVYKELQKIKFPALREKKTPVPAQSTHNPNTTLRQPRYFYSQVASSNRLLQSQENNTSSQAFVSPQQFSNNSLETMLTKMMEKMDVLLNLLTSVVAKLP